MDTNTGDIQSYIEELKSRLDIVEVIERDEPLTRKGREWRGTRNHSLQVSPDVGLWRDWGESRTGGDAIRWVELKGKPFKVAVEELARLAGMHPPQWGRSDSQAVLAAQVRYAAWDVARAFFERKRRNCEEASRYCYRRGWVTETLDALHIGYFDGDYDGLRAEFKRHDIDVFSPEVVSLVGYRGDVRTWAKGHEIDITSREYWIRQGYIAGLPKHVLVFPHIEMGRTRYFSTRSVCLIREVDGTFVVWNAVNDTETRYAFNNDEERKLAKETARKKGKRHYNLANELAGPRIPYWGSSTIPGRSDVVIVEGQADVVTLEQWGIPAVALAGCQPDDTTEGMRLLRYLAESQRKSASVWVGTDSDDAGATGARKLAKKLDVLLRVIRWPDHDANDWLQTVAQDRGNPVAPTDDELKCEAARACEILDVAQPYLLLWAEKVGTMNDHEKAPQLDELITAFSKLPQENIELNRKAVAESTGLSIGSIDRLLKAKRNVDDDGDTEKPMLEHATTGGFVNGHLIEMLFVPPEGQPANAILLNGGKTLFAVRDSDNHISMQAEFPLPEMGYNLVPLKPNSTLLAEGKVIFAPQVGEILPPSDLINRIRELIHKYVDIDSFYESLSAYYVLFTWFFDIFPTLSYLRVKGEAGTGKTRFLEVVGSLCYRPLLMNAGSSVAAMFRTMNGIRGTLVLDEGDFTKSDESADIAKLLNVGNQRRQGHISRAGSKENSFEPEFFNVYGPKIISTRKTYQDNAIESRCLTHETGSPTTRTDIPNNLPDIFWTEEVPEMQSFLVAYRLRYWSPDINKKEIPLDTTIERRVQQVTDSLRKMINNEEMEEELKKFIHEYNNEMIRKRGERPEAKLLESLYIAWETQNEVEEERRNLSLTHIAEIMNDLIDFENGVSIERWKRYKDVDKNKITPRGAGKWSERLQLKTYKPGWDRTRRRHIEWNAERIPALWQRYGLGDDEARSLLLTAWYEAQATVHEYAENLKADMNKPQAFRR